MVLKMETRHMKVLAHPGRQVIRRVLAESPLLWEKKQEETLTSER